MKLPRWMDVVYLVTHFSPRNRGNVPKANGRPWSRHSIDSADCGDCQGREHTFSLVYQSLVLSVASLRQCPVPVHR